MIDLQGESEPTRERKKAKKSEQDQAGPSRARHLSTPRANGVRDVPFPVLIRNADEEEEEEGKHTPLM